jgi:PAS domain S-box-containing protein
MLHSAELIDLDGRRRVIRVSHDITERKLAEEALRENERMLATLFRNLPGMVYRCHNDIEWTMEFVSDGCRELTGYAPLDLQGNHTVSFGSLIHPWDRPRIHSEVQSALKAQKAFEVIYRIRTSDNREKWVWERGRGISPISPQDGEIEGFITDITETRHAELEREQAIRREQAARIQYTLQLIAAQEAERTRIARELHDSLGQNLLLIKNHAQLALLRASEPNGWQNQMDHISDLVSKAIEEVRQISHNLHPYRIDHLGLTQALTILIDDAARSSGVVFERRIEDIDDVLPPDHAINLYRFIQECINNILKHSQAKKVSIQIERDISELQLEVKDDGHGFDAKLQETTGNGLGLKNMADRVRILHGRFTLDSSPGNGASIRVTIPIPAEKS